MDYERAGLESAVVSWHCSVDSAMTERVAPSAVEERFGLEVAVTRNVSDMGEHMPLDVDEHA